MFYLFKNSHFTQWRGGGIPLFMFWHSKSNTLQLSQHKLKEANKYLLKTFFLFWILPVWLCGWRCINSSVCATNAEVSKHSWFGAVLQLLHSTTKNPSHKYPNFNNTHHFKIYQTNKGCTEEVCQEQDPHFLFFSSSW